MKLYLEKRVLLGFLVALSIILWLGIYSYRNNQKFAATSKLISHTNKVLFHIEQVLTMVTDMETSQRGYVITLNEIFLEPFILAADTIDSHLSTLSQLTSENAIQQKNIETLTMLVHEKIDFVNDVIADRKISFEAARQRILSMKGNTLIKKIRGVIAEMKAEENRRLDERVNGNELDFKASNYAFIQLLIAISIILILVFMGINFNLRARTLAEDALLKSSEKTQDLYENAPCGYHSLNPEGVVVDINKTLLTWLGYERNEVINKLGFRDLISAETLPVFEENFRVFKAQKFIRNLEFQFIKKDGTTFPVIINSTAIEDAKGNYVKSRSTVFDLTDRKVAEDKIKQLNRELEAFTYSVSHDLRAPLRSIDGYTKILEEDYGSMLDDEGRRIMNVVMNNAKRMGQLIDDLLDFSRIGRKELSKALHNPDNMVHSIVKELSESEANREIDFVIHPLLPAQADVVLMRQVWINLISNAVKYTRKTPKPKIEINSYLDKNEVVYCIQDNGVGFDMQYAHKLFGVFQRLHKVQDFEGTGVGLAIVSRSIYKHGGRVWADASLNRGATFYFTLPIETV